MKNIDFINLQNYITQQNNNNWLITSILYSSYNSVLLIPVLISLKNYINKTKNIKYISIIVSILSIIFLLLINVDVDIKNLEMPAVYAVEKIWHNMKAIYGIIILISIFTTAISLGMSFLNNVSKNQKNIII